jgi:hypothetical protein
VTYCVLFFIHLKSRKVDIAGITVIGGLRSPTHATPSGHGREDKARRRTA